jgi:hypothetical protein
MPTMPEEFLTQNFLNKPENHVAYKRIADIESLGRSTQSGLSGMDRFTAEMTAAGLKAVVVGNYLVVYRAELHPPTQQF